MSAKPTKKVCPKKPARRTGPKPINLALQGGGAHGAFTWGVLDRILEDKRLDIEGISATSAGAMNAVVMLDGWLEGGAKRASEKLHDFWHQISTITSFSPMQPTAMEKLFGQTDFSHSPSFYAMDFFTRLFSPYQYNPFDINPLRQILGDMVDFDRLSKNKEMQLFVNATNVSSGKIRVFNTSELTIDAVMASACLPFLFKTVHIDGEPYWDGGYSGNPALFPLFYACTSPDIMVVQINPLHVDSVPTHAAEILDRVNEISFNATLIREMRAIEFVKRLLKEHRIPDTRYSDVRVHLVEAEDLMKDIGASSKFNADWDFLTYLHDIGYNAADGWLAQHYDKIGKESSIDIEEYYL